MEHLTEVRTKCAAVLGTDHPHTLRAGYALGVAMHHAGRTAEATATLGEVLTGQERKLGPPHPDTLETRVALAEIDRDASTAA